MSIIDVRNLTFGYDGTAENVFENTSFRLDTDWKLGFTGRNGRGKTTFLKLLMGEYKYSGRITASVGFEYFPYAVDESELAIDAARSINPDVMDWELERELSLLSVGSDALRRSFSTLSMGERTKLLLAVMFTKPNSFLLIDEPTNHLDMEARGITAEYLNSKRGFILVSHDRAFLDACTDHTLSINRANIEVTSGNFSVWYENKQLRDAFELSENEKLKQEISRLKSAAREKSAWSDVAEGRKIGFDPRKTEKSLNRRAWEGAKSKKLQARAKAIEKRTDAMIDEKSSLLKNLEETEDLRLNPLTFHSKRLVEFRKADFSYGVARIFDNFDFTLSQGERVAVVGANGSGKSTLLKLILGELEFDRAESVYFANGLKFSYLRQDVSLLSGSIDDFGQGIDRVLFRAILRKLGFSRGMFEKPLETYSAGQKKKAALAKSLSEPAHIYVWDEPMNYIDIYSRMQIEELVKRSDATIIFVEHDRAFCDSAATRIIRL